MEGYYGSETIEYMGMTIVEHRFETRPVYYVEDDDCRIYYEGKSVEDCKRYIEGVA